MKSFFIGAFAAIMACLLFFAALYGWHRLTHPEEYVVETEETATAASSSSDASSSGDSSATTARQTESPDYRQGYDDGYQAALGGGSASSSAQTAAGSALGTSASAEGEDLTLYNETVMSEHRTPKNPAYGQTLSYADAWSPYGSGTLPGEDAASSSYASSPDAALNGDTGTPDTSASASTFTPESDLYSGENPDTLSNDPVLPAGPQEEWIQVPAHGIP